MQVERARPARQQVGTAAPQLADTRTRQRKSHAAGLDEAVDLVEQCRHLLHLVDEHDGRLPGSQVRFDIKPERRGGPGVAQELIVPQQVDDQGAGPSSTGSITASTSAAGHAPGRWSIAARSVGPCTRSMTNAITSSCST